MSLIDKSYFINDISLPDGRYDGDYTTEIAKYEKEFLIKCFGYTLYKLIAAYTSISPQRIKDIVEGKEFELSPYTYKWNGLKNTELISPLAYYCYFNIMTDKISSTYSIGEVKPSTENGTIVDSGIKLVRAWNNMFDLVGLPNNYRVDSLYYFMLQNYATYPEWQFEGFQNINTYGI